MSRIIIKNLPKNITEEKLRELFTRNGLITDIQLKYTQDGKFRQFAFIGYQNESEADEVVKHFNNSRINTTKITVELCALLGDAKKSKSRTKLSVDSLVANKKGKQKEKTEDAKAMVEKPSQELLNKYKNDPMFTEFLQVHSAQAALDLIKTRDEELIQNSKSDIDAESDSAEQDLSSEEIKAADKNISDLEYMKALKVKKRTKMEKKPKEKIDLFTIKLKNLPYNCKKNQLKQFFKPLVPYTIRLPRNIKGIAYVGFKQEKQCSKALLKDKSILDGKQISVIKYNKHAESTTEDPPNSQQTKWKTQEESLKHEEDIGESGKIFIRNLSYTTTENDLQTLFEKYGAVVELNLPVDSVTRKLKGFGVVTYLMPEHAVKAYSELDGTILNGRMLHLLPGKPKDSTNEEGQESSNYKKKKTKDQKAQSGSSHNWNSLFLGHNAVADVIAETYKTSKESVLNPHGDGAAVRLALGETQIVAATRKYLEEHGVQLNAFNELNSKRSKTTILVKNLPSNTEVKEINYLFRVHGDISQIIFPPSAITAIIEFVEPSEARKAFTKLAYTKFKNLPLYLEWAPETSISPKASTLNQQSNVKDSNEVSCNKGVSATEESEQIHEEECDEEPEPDTTLFVKNLDFKTTDAQLKKHFESSGKVYYATVATKKDKNNPNGKLSMGYGFVRFFYKVSADKALKNLQQSKLEGKSLELKRSERILNNEKTASRKSRQVTKQTGTKILIRNIPFQSNKREVTELFKTFGEIKGFRLPKKMGLGTEGHRGFAFVDYTTNAAAKSAFEALSQSTHLYGRRLVLEWASAEEEVSELRKRTADHFHPTIQIKSKKSVLDLEKK